MPIEIFIHPKVSKSVRKLMKGIFKNIHKVTPIHHKILVYVGNWVAVCEKGNGAQVAKKIKGAGGDKLTAGRFYPRGVGGRILGIKRHDCAILLAGRISALAGNGVIIQKCSRGMERSLLEHGLMMAAFHELVHYCQYRDRKPLTEEGVDKKTKRLFRRFERVCKQMTYVLKLCEKYGLGERI